MILQDLDYSYDVVGNPTEIRDWRTPEEWPAGSKPTTRRMEYDDLNRVTRVDYEYPGGWDKSVSPFAAEMAGTQTDPRIPLPRNQKLLPTRPAWQTYQYDWLGNQTKTDDDQHAFYERSLGTIVNNSTGKPYQVSTGSQSPSGGANNGSFGTVLYDAAGNLTHIQLLEKTQACTTVLSSCISRLDYYWDEVGRLMQARRVDTNVTGNALVYVNYAYDANDERVIKMVDPTGTGNTASIINTLYVFDSLEIRRAVFDSASGDYPLNDTNEVPYLDAHGMRLGRVVKEPGAFGEPRSPSTNPVHVFMELPDHLGSASIVIDRDTSELVEARTYQPFGAEESDYRPDRWKGFREDYGFTGKEEDVEVGVQYFGKRFFSPYLGRWLSPDPLAVHVPGSANLNLYAYVNGAVLKATDPLGLCGPNESCPIDWTQVARNVAAGQIPLYAAIQEFKTGNYGRGLLRLSPTTSLMIMAPYDLAHTFKATSESIGACFGGQCGTKEKTQLVSAGVNFAIGAVAMRLGVGKVGAVETAASGSGVEFSVTNAGRGILHLERADGKGWIAISTDKASKTMTVEMIESLAKGEKGIGTSLYEAALDAAKGVMGEVKTIKGKMEFDNKTAIAKGGIEASPAVKIRNTFGFTEHVYDPASKMLTSTRPDPGGPATSPPATSPPDAGAAATVGPASQEEKPK